VGACRGQLVAAAGPDRHEDADVLAVPGAVWAPAPPAPYVQRPHLQGEAPHQMADPRRELVRAPRRGQRPTRRA